MMQPSTERRPAQLLVAERDGDWAVRLRRLVGPLGPRVVETRSLVQLWERLAEAPASFAVAELTLGGVEGLVQRLVRLPRDFPQAQVAVVAPRSHAAYEGLLLEAGAVLFVASPRRLAPLAEMACRRLAQSVPAGASLVEQIWDRLPWKAAIA